MCSLDAENTLDFAPIPIVTTDCDGRILSANASACNFFGRERADLLYIPVDDIVPADGFTLALRNAQTNEGRATCERSVNVMVGDTPRVVRADLRSWRSAGDQNRTTIVFHDVTDQDSDETGPRSTLGRWDRALTGAQIGIFELDLQTGRSIVSETWKELMGLFGEANLDCQAEWRSRVHPDDLPMVLEADRACIEGRSERSLTRYRLRRRDGSGWQWMSSNAVAVAEDTSGRALQLIGTQADVTDLKLAEDALRKSVSQFRSVFEHAPIGQAIMATDGTLLQVNSALSELLGYPENEMFQLGIKDLAHPEDIRSNSDGIRTLTIGERSSLQVEMRFRRADGSVVWGLLSASAVPDDSGSPIHFIVQILDATEQRKLFESKRELVATVSHELRTPLTSILGALDLFPAVVTTDLPAEASRLIHIARANAERLRRLVGDILDFEKLSVGGMQFRIGRHDVNALLEQSVNAGQTGAKKYGVRFEFRPSESGSACWVDPDRFQQVVANLLSNAAKFSDPDSAVDIRTSTADGFTMVSVTNRGETIPKDLQHKIFIPFSQFAAASAPKREGTGLGLSICKQIVEKMGGRIGFETEGRSTTLWFTVPMADVDGSTIARA